jgi:DNA invertase Pin-like site-specific DNA recombinase
VIKTKRAALYVRVSTDQQTVAHQREALQAVAERRGWQVVEIYSDAGISGAKGRDKRPGLDDMLNDAKRRKFDVVMAWAIDRLGRSLIDLLGTIGELEAAGVDLYLDQQNIDTTSPMGKLLFQITGAFAEFERTMIRQRIAAGLKTVKATIEKTGSFRPAARGSCASVSAARRRSIPRSSRRRAASWLRARASSRPPSAWGSARVRCTACVNQSPQFDGQLGGEGYRKCGGRL